MTHLPQQQRDGDREDIKVHIIFSLPRSRVAASMTDELEITPAPSPVDNASQESREAMARPYLCTPSAVYYALMVSTVEELLQGLPVSEAQERWDKLGLGFTAREIELLVGRARKSDKPLSWDAIVNPDVFRRLKDWLQKEN